MSRFLDEDGVEADLFGAAEPSEARMTELTAQAGTRAFQGFHPDTISGLLRSARHIERTTRHKMNPNCPTYGDRESLVTAGILTNDIPEV